MQEPPSDESTLSKPNCGGNIWPRQSCPAFAPRKAALINECWYCRHADFHLDKDEPLAVGICRWPDKNAW